MNVGAPFNPYKIFRGVFAPYWILEHKAIGSGAKLCYIRLLGFAGKDARCYPSIQKLGASLGVCERQAREYVKELERSGLIGIEQRGLRKTNMYAFLWTAELESMAQVSPGEAGEVGSDEPCECGPDRKNPAGQDRNRPADRHASAVLDRKSSAGQDRQSSAGPIGRNSSGIISEKLSSSSAGEKAGEETRRTNSLTKLAYTRDRPDPESDRMKVTAERILLWAQERRVLRLRSDRRIGVPENEHLQQWAEILTDRGVTDEANIAAVLNCAFDAACRSGEWRRWAFLTIQVQLAAEQLGQMADGVISCGRPEMVVEEDPSSEWAVAKERIRASVGEIPFKNWFDQTYQLERTGERITIGVSDEPSLDYLKTEYAAVIANALAKFGIFDIVWRVVDRRLSPGNG